MPADISRLLASIKKADAGQLSVSEEDGRFMRVLVISHGTKHALEIGGASGYSGIWIGLGLRETGGHLTTIEFDEGRAKAAADNIRRAGLADVVTVVHGDAFKEIPKIAGTFDFVFLDAWKPDYKRSSISSSPASCRAGCFSRTTSSTSRREMRDFLAAISDSPALATSIVRPGSEGMSVSVKLR